jgi:2-methylcitrate dehydratase PrpD
MVEQFSPDRINSDDVWRLIPKITARHNPEFDKGGPLKRGSTQMRVVLADGSVLETSRTVPKTVGEPMSNDDVVRKFHTLTDGLLADQRRRDIADAVLALETMPDVAALIKLLAPQVRSAFD